MAADIYHTAETLTMNVGQIYQRDPGLFATLAGVYQSVAPLSVIPVFQDAASIGGACHVRVISKAAGAVQVVLENVTGRFSAVVRLDYVYWRSPQGTA